MAPKAEIGFCDFKVNSVIEGFSQSIEWKLNIWFNTSPALGWSPRIKTPSEAVKTQNETPGSQALAAHAGLHWGVRSPIWPKVFLKLSWLSFVLAAVIYVWSLSSIHCYCYDDCNSLMAQWDFLSQYVIATENSGELPPLALPCSPRSHLSLLYCCYVIITQ